MEGRGRREQRSQRDGETLKTMWDDMVRGCQERHGEAYKVPCLKINLKPFV